MSDHTILGHHSPKFSLFFFYFFIIFFAISYLIEADVATAAAAAPNNSFTVSTFTYDKTVLQPYKWRYIRVDLPPWFSSMSVELDSDVDIDPKSISQGSISKLPMICFAEGSLPLPDVYNTSSLVLYPIFNGSFEGVQGSQFNERCYLMQKHISVRLTNAQISAGTWYFGLFNGIGAMRLQSKMINRGPSYSFSGNVSVEGCIIPMMWGKYCNQTVEQLSCFDSYNLTKNRTSAYLESMTSCRNSYEKSCSGNNESKIYSLDVMGIAQQITITATNIGLNQTQTLNGTTNGSRIVLMCYVRHGAMPLETLHDYSGNITNAPLVIQSPKVGRWYISVQPVNLTEAIGRIQDSSIKVCHSLDWQVLHCPMDKAGLNCTSEKYELQTVRKHSSGPFESYYMPVSDRVLSDSGNFVLEPLLSNSSYGGNSNDYWTYFVVNVPSGAAGGNMHIRLSSDVKIEYQIYAKYGGLSSPDSWDYFYVNATSSSNGSMFFKLYDSTEEAINFYILYIKGGIWSFAVRNPGPPKTFSGSETTMSISFERCPKGCYSPHGTCQNAMDASGLTLYSYCDCDRDHGGFDCSVELVSHKGHIWQSIFLIASNAAAVLPAYWALRQKAFAEWILFTSSGISSGLYHACDVGTWCVLKFGILQELQFMDFWLSFMAVVSTFVYLADISDGSKRTIHTVVAIVTALMAEKGPTSSSNIILVIVIGAAGLLVGWMMESVTHFRTISVPAEFSLDIHQTWQSLRAWLQNVFKTLLMRFRWGFVLAGFTALGIAAISWQLETSESYWIWHSVWHITIYTSSFLFLCSKAKLLGDESQRAPLVDYELTRQDSFSRGR